MPVTSAGPGELARNVLLMAEPGLWPAWPFLPLVRRKAGEDDECGLLYDAFGRDGRTGFSATVFLCNLFLLPTQEEFFGLPREVYDAAEEVYLAGWRVD